MGVEVEKMEVIKLGIIGSGYVVYCLDISGFMGGII